MAEDVEYTEVTESKLKFPGVWEEETAQIELWEKSQKREGWQEG